MFWDEVLTYWIRETDARLIDVFYVMFDHEHHKINEIDFSSDFNSLISRGC